MDEQQGRRGGGSVQGVILDVDGTFVLSNDAHARAWVEAFAEFGYTVPFERERPLIGMGADKLIPKVVVLGDTPYDIEAARKLGVPTVALRCGGFDDSQLAGAVAIYDSPADLLAHYETSPLKGTPIR